MSRKLLVLLFLLGYSTFCMAAPCSFTVTINKQDVDCYGNTTGTAEAVVVGTTSPYTFLWSTGETTSTITGLKAETYFVKVIDKNGCEIMEFIQVNQPDKITITSEVEHAKCFAENTGSIITQGSGGFGVLSYLWSNGVEVKDNISLYQGLYSLTITDENYCELKQDFSINQPNKLTETHVIQNVLGYELSNGAIDISVDGGTMPYRYKWYESANLIDTLEDIYGLNANTYTATITDLNNCLLQTSITVTQPPKLESSYQVTPVNCKEGTDGSIDLTVVGGVPPYSYIWANSEKILNENGQDATGLKKDHYYVTITDFNGISIFDSIFVDEPTNIQASLIPTNANCFSSSDGSIDLTVSGGEVPYTFLWSDNTTNQNLSNVVADDYSVLIVDKNGCSLLAESAVGEPELIVIDEVITQVTCKDQSDGTISTTITGGISPYDFVWSNGETTQDVIGLDGGDYSVTVIDQHSCEMVKNYYLQMPEFICIWIPNAFTPNGDNINDEWIITNSFLYPGLSVTVFNKDGFEIFASNGYKTPWNGAFNNNQSPAGTYYYIVDPKNGDKPFTGTLTIVR